MCWVQLLTSTTQFLCISILETLLHVTLTRRTEISADIFAHLYRYLTLSYKNLTTTHFYPHILHERDLRLKTMLLQLNVERMLNCLGRDSYITGCRLSETSQGDASKITLKVVAMNMLLNYWEYKM